MRAPSRARSTARAHRHGAHVVEGDPGLPAAPLGQHGRDRHDGGAARLHARHLAEAERIGIETGNGNRFDDSRRTAVAKEVLDRQSRATACEHDRCAERQQRRREFAIWRWREEIATGGCGGPHGRATDDPRRGSEDRKIAVRQDLRHRRARADGDAIAFASNLLQSWIGDDDERVDTRVGLVDRPHQERPATVDARRAIGGDGSRRIVNSCDSLDANRHQLAPAPERPSSPRMASNPAW